MSVGAELINCDRIVMIGMNFTGYDRCIEMTSCSNFYISKSGFFDSNEAVFLANCYGKAFIKKNSTFNVNTLVSVNDSKNVISSQSKNSKSQQKFDPIPESKKLVRKMEIKYKRLIQKLLNLEAENKFLKNHKQVRIIKDIKSNLGTTRSYLLLKQLLHKASQ